MAFTDHKIQAFTKKLADLPDEPNLSAAELKGYFDSSPEELRGALNSVCEDAARLDTRVSGIVTETFGDAIPKSMLAAELQSEIDAKAEEAALSAAKADISANQAAIAQKCEIHCGFYVGDGAETRQIDLGYAAKAVFIALSGYRIEYLQTPYGGLALQDKPVQDSHGKTAILLTENGFEVYNKTYQSSGSHFICTNEDGEFYTYFVIR